jgi:PhnB protein
MQINPYLNFDGTCREAFTFYAGLFGGEIGMMMTWGESPMAGEMPPEMRDRVMHVSLSLGPTTLMGSDAPPDRFQPAQGIWVSLSLDDEAEAERLFAGLSDGGSVAMALEPTFWAKRFGMVTDRFGTPWMLNCS